MEFKVETLVYPSESNGNPVTKCNLCHVVFKSNNASSIKRHYKQTHAYKFKVIRKRKAAAIASTDGVLIKKRRGMCFRCEQYTCAEDIIKICMKIHVDTNLGYETWNHDFRAFFIPCEKKFGLSLEPRVMRDHIAIASNRITKLIEERLANRLFSLQLDIGSRDNRSFIRVAVQHMIDFDVKLFHLGIIKMKRKEKDTPIDICQEIQSLLNSFGLKMSQIYSVSTDNGTYLDKECEEIWSVFGRPFYYEDESDADRERVTQMTEQVELANSLDIEITPMRSAAHMVHSAIYDWLKLQLPDEILATFKEAFTKLQEKIEDDRDSPFPSDSNLTHCSLIYCMLEGMLNNRSEMDDELSQELWDLAVEVVQLLDAVKQLTTNLQKVQYVFGDLLMDIIRCEVRLTKINTTRATTLLNDLIVQKVALIDNIKFLACLYLDPRFNNCTGFEFLTNKQKDKALRYLLELHERMSKKDPDSPSTSNPDSHTSPSEDSPTTSAGSSSLNVNQMPSDEELFMSESSRNNSAEREVIKPTMRQRLVPLERCSRPKMDVFDIGQYWKGLANKDPEMGELANVVLATPVSQVSAEQVFSSLPAILTALAASQSISIKHLLNVKFNIHEL